MIVRSLQMESIRSYKKARVEFPMGKTLFEGDIGSGKSTILMAIEFALFGLGSARASSLLRVGEVRGSVELEFETGGNEYSVKRVLARKGTSVQQVEGKLKGPDGEKDYPATEMKERILEILNFREPPQPNAKSLLFQYAIYSPQEEMKLILALTPNDRLSILRRAFGVEEYKNAMENAKELARKIHEKRTRFEDASREIPALRKEVAELEAKSEKGETDSVALDKLVEEREGDLSRLEKEKEGLHEFAVQLASVSKEHEHLARKTGDLRVELAELESEILRIEKKMDRLPGEKRLLNPPSEKTVAELKAAVESLREGISKHKASDVEIGMKIGQFESVAKEGKCPVCEQEADLAVFAGRIGSLSEEKKKNQGHLDRLLKDLKETDALLDRRREYDELVVGLERDRSLARDYAEDADKKKGKAASAKLSLDKAEKELSKVEGMVKVLEGETKGLDALQRKMESAHRELKANRDKASSLRSDIRKWREDVKRRSESIVHKEKFAQKATFLGEREIWLEEFFVPSLQSIERHVMTSINHEFGVSFQRWFGSLVDDPGKGARVDENFSPVIDQGGYDQDVEFLSGGERTSVALAYRLSLSQMVQRYAEVGPSTLILDEPTDGFSKEQLGKVREILDEIGNPQVVIVSHERELESMADQIFRVAKVDGESKITR